jgi:hypothetical protein
MVAGTVIEHWDMSRWSCETEMDKSHLTSDYLAALVREREQLAANIAFSEQMIERSKGLLRLMDQLLARSSGLKH